MNFTKFGDKTVGIIYTNPALAWRPRSDLVLYNCQKDLDNEYVKGINPSKVILTYYYWDYMYGAFETVEKWKSFLRRFKDQGVNKTAFQDFSTWYQEPEQQRYDTIMRAFEFANIADSLGFEMTWNNNLYTARFDKVSKLLPNIDCYIVSANHYEDTVHPEAIRDGRNAYEIMVGDKKAQRVLFITDRKDQSSMPWFFDGRVTVSVIRTEMGAMRHLRKTLYA